jgi:hypothetical protein
VARPSLIFAPLLMPVAVWLYTLVFAFASLWFAHFALARSACRPLRGGCRCAAGAPAGLPPAPPPLELTASP